MQYPAKSFSIVPMLAIFLALTACNDKANAPAEPDKSVAVQKIPDENKQLAQEPTIPEVKTKEIGDATKNSVGADNEPVKALSIEEGKKRYEQTCKVCHGQGLLDAPKLTNKAEWAKRLEKGIDTLHQHSAKGFNKMPAQAVGAVSEAEVYAAVDYMLEQAK